jgi:hypothetical protein
MGTLASRDHDLFGWCGFSEQIRNSASRYLLGFHGKNSAMSGDALPLSVAQETKYQVSGSLQIIGLLAGLGCNQFRRKSTR